MATPQGESSDSNQLWLLEQRATKKRMVAEVLAGVLLGAAGAAPGIIRMADGGICDPFEVGCHTERQSRFIGGLAMGAAGYSVGAMLGIFVGGTLMGGEGGFPSVVAGALAGELVGVVIAVVSIPITAFAGWYLAILTGSDRLLSQTITIGVPAVVSMILAVAPLVGGIGFYEGTHRKAVERKQAASAGVQVLPIVGMSPHGGLVAGLAARF